MLSACDQGTTPDGSRSAASEGRAGEQSEGFNVRNGSDASGKDSVGFFSTPTWGTCSAVEVKDRCILTSAHCMFTPQGQQEVGVLYYQDADPFADLDHVTATINIMPPLLHPLYDITQGTANSTYHDLALVWMDGLECTGGLPNHPCLSQNRYNPNSGATEADWQPAVIKRVVEDLDDYDNSPTPVPPYLEPVGYGALEVGFPFESWKVHKRTKTSTKYLDTTLGPPGAAQATKGSALHAQTPFPPGTNPHPDQLAHVYLGDSGGGVFYGGSLIATISNNGGIAEYWATRYTHGNSEFMTTKLEQYCRPRVDVLVSVEPDSSGLITGQASDPLDEYDYNWEYFCSHTTAQPGDICMSQEPIIDLSLNAEPMQGYSFVEWASGNPASPCPCEGSTSPDCEFSADEIPLKMEVFGIHCKAVFAQNSPPPCSQPMLEAAPVDDESKDAWPNLWTAPPTPMPTGDPTSTPTPTTTPCSTPMPTEMPSESPTPSPSPLESPF